jgi:hypothetical protein
MAAPALEPAMTPAARTSLAAAKAGVSSPALPRRARVARSWTPPSEEQARAAANGLGHIRGGGPVRGVLRGDVEDRDVIGGCPEPRQAIFEPPGVVGQLAGRRQDADPRPVGPPGRVEERPVDALVVGPESATDDQQLAPLGRLAVGDRADE